MTEDAARHFQAIADRYRVAGAPERRTWLFDGGRLSDANRELEAAGWVERVFGTAHGFSWRLTDAGVARIRELT